MYVCMCNRKNKHKAKLIAPANKPRHGFVVNSMGTNRAGYLGIMTRLSGTDLVRGHRPKERDSINSCCLPLVLMILGF